MTPEPPSPVPNPDTPGSTATADWLSPRRFALVLTALLAITFWRVLFGGEAFFYRDYGFLGYPFVFFHHECFWNGDFFPLWNPYVNCGAPFLAQWNTLCLYPGALIYLLLPLPWSLGFFCVAHLFLGGMGMRALAERWTGSPFGAAVAGVAFVFSGLVLGCVIYPNYLVALGWMPWVVLATRRAWQEGGRSIVLAALSGAMQMLSGAPEIILLTWGFLAALLVVDWVQGPRSKVQSRSAQGSCGEPSDSSLTPALSRWEREGAGAASDVSSALLANPAVGSSVPKSVTPEFAPPLTASPPLPAGEGRGEGEHVRSETTSPPLFHHPTNHFALITRFAAVISLITGLCAAQLLPFFQLLSLSQRSGDAVNTFWSLPGWGWVNLFFPLFMNFQTEQGVFVMIGQSFFPSVYLGIVPLTLALLAVWRVRTPEVKLLGAATLLAVLLAMGDNFPLWGWLRSVLPLGVVRFPAKALLLAAFTVPLLAAWGLAEFEARLQAAVGDVTRDPKRLPLIIEQCLMVGTAVGALGLLLLKVNTQFPVPTPTAEAVQLSLAGCIAVLFTAAALVVVPQFRRLRPLPAAVRLSLLLLVAAHGTLHLNGLNPTIPASAFEPGDIAAYHANKGALTPAPKLGESRIMLSPLAERALHTRMVPKFYDDFIGQRLAFWGNLNLLDGLPKVNGASTLVTREWNDVDYLLYGTTNPAPANLMDFLGVTHTTKPGELMQWERRETAMPLVSLPLEAVLTYRKQSLAAVTQPDWNPRSTAYLTFEAPDDVHFTPVKRIPFSTGSVRMLRFSPTRLELETDTMERRPLVVAQNHYPSWHVTVNGETEFVAKANHAFQAIMVPAGKSTIRLDYVDWPFRIGAGISVLTLLGCALLWRRGSP